MLDMVNHMIGSVKAVGGSPPPPTMYYRVPMVVASNASSGLANTTSLYYCTGGDFLAGNATLANVETRVQTEGTIKNFRMHISSNSSTTSSTFRLLKNGVATSLTVTIGAGSTGLIEDTLDTVSVVAGDLLAYEIVRSSAESISIAWVACDMMNLDATTYHTASAPAGATGSVASVNRFSRPSGTLTYAASIIPSIAPAGFTAKNIAVYVSSNARTSATVFNLQKNGVDTAVSVTVGAGVTGWVTNTSSTETFAAGDSIQIEIATGVNAGSIVYHVVCWEATPTTTGRASFIMGANASNMTAANSPRRTPIGADQVSFNNSAGNAARLKVYGSGTYRNAYCNATGNTCDVSINHKIRAGGVDTGINAVVTALTNGTFSDTSNTYAFSSGEFLELEISRAGTGAYTLGAFSYASDITQETL